MGLNLIVLNIRNHFTISISLINCKLTCFSS